MEFMSIAGAAGSFLQDRRSRYETVGKLGRGSFGAVTVAIDRLTQQRVAVKQQPIPSEQATREMSAYTVFF